MNDVPKVVVNYHIKRLKDKSPDVRLNAIDELRKIGDADALEPLQEVYKSDDNVDVKKAAQEAGRAIWQSKQSQSEA
ncbi:MAG: HEAT repeat domain-containing protein [Chloroflexota bacterium]